MRPLRKRSKGRGGRFAARWFLAMVCIAAAPALAFAQFGLTLKGTIPGEFDPEADLRAPKPLCLYGSDSLAALNHEALLFRIETELDTSTGYYVSRRLLFGQPYGHERVFTREQYRDYTIERQRRKRLAEKFEEGFLNPPEKEGGGAIEIQVPFRIKSKTFRRIFGGDRVGLRVTGNISIDGSLRRENSDQVITTRTDQTNTNFKIDQTQQFHIVGKVGDKVSVEIDQNSERVFDFENSVRLEYQGEEDEVIQSIEAGNISLTLPGTQLATFSGQNKGLFGFKTLSKIGPLSFTAIASLQKGEKNKKTFKAGSEQQTYEIDDLDYVKNQYFFLDYAFRDAYPRFTNNYERIPAPVSIERIEVYRSIPSIPAGTNQVFYEGIAYFDPPVLSGSSQDVLQPFFEEYEGSDSLQSEKTVDKAFFERLTEGEDYSWQQNLGFIRLNYPAGDDQVIAVAFKLTTPFPGDPSGRTQWGVLDPTGTRIILKMVKPRNPVPTDTTWNLSWKHVYWVGTTNLSPDDFDLKLIRVTDRKDVAPNGKSWLEVFGLDTRSRDGSTAPDGIIDPFFVDYGYGEIAFPDLRPFDPAGYEVGGELKRSDLDTLVNPDIYDRVETRNVIIQSNFALEATYSKTSAQVFLEFNVLEGSEEVFLNGRQLKKDVDYIIDYLSGQVTILNQEAFAPNANLEINYESGAVFQLDKRTMLGFRVEYALWEDSFIGGTFLYFNEKPLDKRVKVGSEPLRNTIWDMNARLRFRPYFMTRMVNALPLIDTDEPSELTFEGEVAQVFPNPNSLNNDATGDPEGVAYIDDFEAARRSVPLSVMRRSWYPASHPLRIPEGNNPDLYNEDDWRGRIFWYNPYQQVPIKEIWPNREVNSKVANSVHVLTLEYDPRVNNFRRGDILPEKTWNGVMRHLSAGFSSQIQTTKFIEIWMKWTGGGPDATFYLDMGQISEDVIPNGKLNTEDKPLFGTGPGNGVLDEGEDLGLDGIAKPDPPWRKGAGRTAEPWLADEEGYDYASKQYDWWDLNGDGEQEPDEPFSTDNYSYERGSYEKVNGSEGNANDEGGRFPDTEDLNGDNSLNTSNNFFRYRFRLASPEDSIKYIRGGQDNPSGWRLIRIPIEEPFQSVNKPEITQVEAVRLWFTGADAYTVAQIAQLELVGNEWVEDPIIDPVSGDTLIYVTAATINTFDNPEDYDPPPGVAGEVDPITDIRSKEQSLVLELLDMPRATEGQLIKSLRRGQDLREYKRLKMFVHGGGRNPQSLADHDIEMFLRFGSGMSGANIGYYEYSQRLSPGWGGNEIDIDLDQLTALKQRMRSGGESFQVLPDGDVMKIVGNPTLGNVTTYAIGIRNVGRDIRKDDGIEVWVDELRLSGIRKEPGLAMRSSLSAKFADFMDMRLDLSQSDAEFHSVDRRYGSTESKIDATLNGKISLGKMFNPQWGINLPLSGNVKSTLKIPKYTENNGDVRTSAVADPDRINIWKRFPEMAFEKSVYRDRYLADENGNPVIDSLTGRPRQDPEAWGVDSLFSTTQTFSWRINFSKKKTSPNWLVKYTLDKLSANFDHAENFNSSINYQYQKRITQGAKLSYSLPFEQSEIRIFRWAEKVPLVGTKLAGSLFNYKPTRLAFNIEGTETRRSEKARNSFERPSYELGLTRSVATGFRPFQHLSFDYSYNIQSQHVREDSTRQLILFNDQPETEKEKTYPPGTDPDTILAHTIAALQDPAIGGVSGAALADSAGWLLAGGASSHEVLDFLFTEIDRDAFLSAQPIKRPWRIAGPGDPRFQGIFWQGLNLPFVDTRKAKTFNASYNPDLVPWFSTDFSYRGGYNWVWNGFTYSGRSVNSNGALNAGFVLRLRQLLPRAGGRGSAGSRPRVPGGEGFGTEPGGRGRERPGEVNPEAAGEKPGPAPPNPLTLLTGLARKLQDIRLDYSQTLTFQNPTVEDGIASLPYQLGLTGDPGLDEIPGFTAVRSSQRADDFRLRTGLDVSSRVSTTFDYSLRFTRNHREQVNGTSAKTTFYLFREGRNIQRLDLPNWNLRWSGLEQIGPLSLVATSISLDHAYNGNFSEDWTELERAGVKVQSINRRLYDKSFNPLLGFNIGWKYGISTTIRFNWSQRVSEDPRNDSKSRDTNSSLSFSATYTRKAGFRIPLPIWPFKNRRFKNETTFTLAFDRTTVLKEIQQRDLDFEQTGEQLNWSLTPSIRYTFSRTVTGGARYKYGVTKSSTFTTRYQEFGINVNIAIRG